ncbi:uncharacterized protein LOC110860907 [Folsomia candida]|uniref:uncharacterized protein LOC110860907 n=1 Tax=Folsomia candida TaxID=158441 RepID=UPI000B8FBF2A|nr:uncharacterized protein LOC110860907 [Folsomia candida]
MKYLILAVALMLVKGVTSRSAQSEEIVSQTRNGINFALTYIGTFNQKLYYHDKVGANNDDARSNCKSMGMRLLKFEAIEEVGWIANATANSGTEIWTDGMTHIVPASFEWKTTGARVSDSLSLVKGHYYGRIISVTSATDRPAWTDGVIKADPGSYRWFSDDSPLISQLKIGYVALGLEIRDGTGLYTWNNEVNALRSYLCYAETS